MIRNYETILSRISIAILFSSLITLQLTGCGKKDEAAPAKTDSLSKQSAVDTSKQGSSSPAANQAASITGLALAGQKIFYNTKYGNIKDACASCHSDGQAATKDTRLRAAHTLVGITSRQSTWNGAFKGDALLKNAYGATMCAVMYQHKGDDIATAIPKADIDALNAYYDAIKNNANSIATNLKIQWITKPAVHEEDKFDVKAANSAAKAIMMLPGDPASGKDPFTHTCAYCHAMKEKQVGPSLSESMKDVQIAVRSVRCGSGAMPFYGKDILTDQQIADVIAYIQEQLGK